MNTKKLIFFMLIAILAIQCSAKAIFPRQEEPAGEIGVTKPDDSQNTGSTTDPAPGTENPSDNSEDKKPDTTQTDPAVPSDPTNTQPSNTQVEPSTDNQITKPTENTTTDTQKPNTVENNTQNTTPQKPQTSVNTTPNTDANANANVNANANANQVPNQQVTTPNTTQNSNTQTNGNASTIINDNTNSGKKSNNNSKYILAGIGAAAVVICIIAFICIRSKKSKDEEFEFTHQPTAYNTYKSDKPTYETGYATAVDQGYADQGYADQYNTQDQYVDQYNNQGYDNQYGQGYDQYNNNNQGYDQYGQQDQYNQGYDQGYDQSYPQDVNDVIPGQQYTIKYDFKPSLSDEIELQPGNVVDVIEVYDDGWAKGRNLTYNTEGVFPINRITGVDETKHDRYSSLARPTQ